jgi:hypothetical protein
MGCIRKFIVYVVLFTRYEVSLWRGTPLENSHYSILRKLVHVLDLFVYVYIEVSFHSHSYVVPAAAVKQVVLTF